MHVLLSQKKPRDQLFDEMFRKSFTPSLVLCLENLGSAVLVLNFILNLFHRTDMY